MGLPPRTFPPPASALSEFGVPPFSLHPPSPLLAAFHLQRTAGALPTASLLSHHLYFPPHSLRFQFMRERERGLGCGLQRWGRAACQRAPPSRVRRSPGGGAWGRVPGVTLQPCSLRAVYTALPALFCNQSKPSPGRGNLIRGPRPRRGEVCARQKGLLLPSRLGRELGDGGGGPRAPEEGGLSSSAAPRPLLSL